MASAKSEGGGNGLLILGGLGLAGAAAYYLSTRSDGGTKETTTLGGDLFGSTGGYGTGGSSEFFAPGSGLTPGVDYSPSGGILSPDGIANGVEDPIYLLGATGFEGAGIPYPEYIVVDPGTGGGGEEVITYTTEPSALDTAVSAAIIGSTLVSGAAGLKKVITKTPTTGATPKVTGAGTGRTATPTSTTPKTTPTKTPAKVPSTLKTIGKAAGAAGAIGLVFAGAEAADNALKAATDGQWSTENILREVAGLPTVAAPKQDVYVAANPSPQTSNYGAANSGSFAPTTKQASNAAAAAAAGKSSGSSGSAAPIPSGATNKVYTSTGGSSSTPSSSGSGVSYRGSGSGGQRTTGDLGAAISSAVSSAASAVGSFLGGLFK